MTDTKPNAERPDGGITDGGITDGGNTDTEFQLIGFPQAVDEAGLRSREPFEVLASQFVDELRRGQRPSVELYARRYPPHAERIRDCFPVLALLEQARIEKESSSFRHNMPERFPFTRLGRCQLLCELGRGGMGVVFQARDADSGHLVAVKVLPWRVSIVPEWQRRFEKEARTAAQLRHRNIVPVFRFGQEYGYCYYVMQFVNSIGLDAVIDRLRTTTELEMAGEICHPARPRPDGFVVPELLPPLHRVAEPEESADHRLSRSSWRSFARIAIQTTQALRCAHAAGILHNDIKPGNLLIDAESRVWVTDFGLSQSLIAVRYGSSTPPRSAIDAPPSGMAGTLRYMAPERLTGTQDARSDLYSLGATLYELVLQQPMFSETNRERLMSAIVEHIPAAPRTVNRDVPRDLENIILNCIAKDPTERYASADQLLADLLKFCSGDHVTSTRDGIVQGLWKALRQKVNPKQD